MKPFAIALLAASSLLASCAAIVQGTTQEITVNTTPQGASCDFQREGRSIGTIPATPGTLKVDRTKFDISIVCAKDGYETSTYLHKSGANVSGTGASILLTGGVGWAVDSASGADNQYEAAVNITMLPKPPPRQQPRTTRSTQRRTR